MSKRTIFVLLVAVTATVAGCNGPTKEGLKNREEAYSRVDAINAQIAHEQAKQAFEIGQLDRAESSILEAMQRVPEAPQYYVLYGQILIEQDRLEPALKAFGSALDVDPDTPDAHYYSGIIFERWSDDERSYDHYLQASQLDESNVHYLLAAAESLVSLNRYEEARAMIAPRLDYFEHNAALRHLEAQIALLEGDTGTAVRMFREARMLRPDDLGLLEELSQAQFKDGQYGPCLDSIRQLRRDLDDSRVDLHHQEAKCLAFLGRTTQARDEYMDLTRLEPGNPDMWIELATVSWELGDYRRVGDASVRVIALAPDRHEGFLLKGMNERRLGRLESAAHLFEQASERAEGEVMPSILLGMTLSELGDREGARLAIEQALVIDPSSTEAQTLLSYINAGGQVTSANDTNDVFDP